MADYGLKYQCTFDPLSDIDTSPYYTIQILQKNYSGASYNITGGEIPVLHEWQTDDPLATIKGSSLTLSFINDGTLPLDAFYSIEDDEYKVKLLWKGQSLFEGFIVQDDCSEILVDYVHNLNISANDNLGLLKDMTLDKADSAFVFTAAGNITFSATAPHTFNVDNTLGALVQPGDKIIITGSSIDGTYTLQTVTQNVSDFTLVVLENVLTEASMVASFQVGKTSLLDNKRIIDIIMMCLQLTGLQLNTYIWGQINETSQDQAKCFFEQTLVSAQTFLKDESNYQDCYTILTNILSAFGYCLFQSMGSWHIMRWDELRYYDNNISAYIYDYTGLNTGSAILKKPFTIGEAQNGLLQRITRPYSYDKETFNYKQPPQILRNYDFKILGTLLRSYKVNVWITGGNVYNTHASAVKAAAPGAKIIATFQTYYEYNAPYWYDSPLAPQTAEYFIRVVMDDIGNEIERYMCAKNDNIRSYKIEANAGDVFKFSFSFKTQDSQPSGSSDITIQFIIELDDGLQKKYLQVNGWQTGSGYAYTIGPGDNTYNWHDVNIDTTSYPIPFDGLLYFYISGTADLLGTMDFTHTKDLSLDYSKIINGSVRTTGQTHEVNQNGNIKNNNDSEIFLDCTKHSAISGTLFLNEMDGVLQKRAIKWRHPYLPAQSVNIGEIVTYERVFIRRKPRTIVEGTIIGLINPPSVPYGCAVSITLTGMIGETEQMAFSWTSLPPGTTSVTVSYFNGAWIDDNGSTTSPRILTNIPYKNYAFRIIFIGGNVTYYFNGDEDHFSLLSLMRYSLFEGQNFVSGKQSIDYKNNKFTGTLYEIWDDGETDDDLLDSYAFTYLYEPI